MNLKNHITPSFAPVDFKPRGEKHLPKSDISGLIPCQLTGPGIYVATTVYVRPHMLEKQIAKYAELGQKLVSRQHAQAATLRDEPATVPPKKPARNPKGSSRMVICLNTGRYYSSGYECAKALHTSQQALSVHLRGVVKQMKGRRLRFATPEEIKAIEANPAWRYSGELFPIVPKGTCKF
ncbi:hypothetical protein GCM10027592_29190 [Spirosoma flavus]